MIKKTFWLGFFSLFAFFSNFGAFQRTKLVFIGNKTSSIVSVWATNKHHSITNKNDISSFWLASDEYYPVGLVSPNRARSFTVPYTRQSLFFRPENKGNLPEITNRPGDDRYDRTQPYRALKPGGIDLDPEPRRTFERNRAILYPFNDYTLTENVISNNNNIEQKGEHESPEFPSEVCRFYVDSPNGYFLQEEDENGDIDLVDR